MFAILFLFAGLLSRAHAASKCVVPSTGFVELCLNGEECTEWGCRCLTAECFHDALKGEDACPLRAQCGSECCRSGELCDSEAGCICAADTKCAPPSCTGKCTKPDENAMMKDTMVMKIQDRLDAYTSGRLDKTRGATQTGSMTRCQNGMAGIYPCNNIDLMSTISCSGLGGGSNSEGNDIWGWEYGERDFVIAGLTTGTSFVEITDPENPVVLGFLPPTQGAAASSIWRDMKVYRNHAYIVSEARASYMQVFDLTRLLDVANPGPDNRFTEDALYTDQMGSRGSTHNIVINEDTGFAYLVGCSTCAGGLLIVDISEPKNPVYAGCYSEDGYTHDAECVVYSGPDHRFLGQEICFAYNEDTLTIVDVTDKSNMVQLARKTYNGVRYSHQGWLTRNQMYLVLDDELDEMYNTYDSSKRTVTYIWSVESLTEPEQLYEYQAPVQAVDHNQYIRGDYSFQANYASGLRVLSGMNDLGNSRAIEEAAYFDLYPSANVAQFYGAWSSFPYYNGKNQDIIAVQAIEGGLFILRFDGLNKMGNTTDA